MKKDNLSELNEVDIVYINHSIDIFPNVPAYSLFFITIFLVSLLTFKLVYILIGGFITFFLFKIAIYLRKKNMSFFNILSMFTFIFKPKYFLVQCEKFIEKRIKNEVKDSNNK